MSSNLPPGVTNSMIEDQCSSEAEFEAFVDEIWDDICDKMLTIEEARNVWRKSIDKYMEIGVQDWEKQFEGRKIKFPFIKINWKPGKGPLDWLFKRK